MEKVILYDYQDDAVKGLSKALSKNLRALLQLPTGGGKTIVFSFIASKVASKNKKVLIISHRIELLTQAGGALRDFGLNPQIITSHTKNIQDRTVYVAMTKTLQNRLDKPYWLKWFESIDLVIIDECHRSEFNYLAQLHCYKIGVTATPKRSGKMPQLLEEYDTIIEGPDVQELINKGRLMPDKYFGTPVDMSGVGKGADGDFEVYKMFEAYNKNVLYKGLIENWKKHTPNTTSICFCCNIQHAIETAKQLNLASIGAKFITSKPSKPKTPTSDNKGALTLYNRKIEEYNNYIENYSIFSGEREKVVQEWKAGKFPFLINAGIFVEGFDHKPTETVVLNLSTTSENKYLQMIGRGSRPSPSTDKKYFNILDFGENATRLGYYRQQREYSLHHTSSKGDGVPPSKECPKCMALVFTSAKICKYCGYEWPKTEQEEVADLVQHEYAQQPHKEIDFSKMTIPELEEYAKQTVKKRAWVWRQIYFGAAKKAWESTDIEILKKWQKSDKTEEKEKYKKDIETTAGLDALKSYAKKNGYHWSWAKRQVGIYNK